jgi:hypothetical protein
MEPAAESRSSAELLERIRRALVYALAAGVAIGMLLAALAWLGFRQPLSPFRIRVAIALLSDGRSGSFV